MTERGDPRERAQGTLGEGRTDDEDSIAEDELEEEGGGPEDPDEASEVAEDEEEVVPRSRYDRVEEDNRKLRARLREIDEAGKSEQQKLAEERDTLRSDVERLRTRVRRSNFIEKIGVSSPRLAWAALQDLSVAVEWDEKDQASNLPQVRKALKSEFPEDFGDRSINGGETGQAPADSDMNARIRAAAGR